ncbi:unnamed protein product, partial [Discosporangium mesarthrocarpum]
VTVIPVTPWGNFTPGLNALLSFAARDNADLILYQSLETLASAKTVAHMTSHLGPDDLVVGAALQGHSFQPGGGQGRGEIPVTGVTSPWNTLAMWDVRKLGLTG